MGKAVSATCGEPLATLRQSLCRVSLFLPSHVCGSVVGPVVDLVVDPVVDPVSNILTRDSSRPIHPVRNYGNSRPSHSDRGRPEDPSNQSVIEEDARRPRGIAGWRGGDARVTQK